MTIEGVMLSYNYSDESEHAKILTVSSSGIKFSDRWVLAHGSLISPLKEAEIILNSKGKALLSDEFYAKLPEIYVSSEKNSAGSAYVGVQELSRERDARIGMDLGHHSYTIQVLTGRICHIWQCPALRRCAAGAMTSWTVAHCDGDQERQTSLGKELLSHFVLVDLETDRQDNKVLRPLSALLDMVGAPPARGTRLEIVSTPFGCEAFLNSVSRGRVSAAVGARPALLLSDAPSALGSEGGAVFAGRGASKALVAMVVCSVSWWRGEWVGLTLLAPLRTVLAAKLRVPPRLAAELCPQDKLLESIDKSTLQIRCGRSWGAGVYLGAGLVLTCAHVVRNYELYKVTVYCQGRKEMAIVRYKSIDDRAFDLALLFTNPQHWTHLTPAVLAKTPAVKGEPVMAAGYPYFTDDDVEELRPTVTAGVVSNVSPALLQTTCCVQSGFSGGPVLRIRDDGVEVLAILTCNATTDRGASHPRLNMSVPADVFRDVVARYRRDKDLSRLHVLNNDLEIIQSQWRLLPYRSKI